MSRNPREESVAVIGSGVSGLITAYTLIRDGFENVEILTKDAHVGGIWARDRIYPGLFLNNVHGEYRLSPLKMPPPVSGGDRLSGYDMNKYFETFASQFLEGKIQFNLDVHNIRRPASGQGWLLDISDLKSGIQETREYARLVMCTGGSSNPRIPKELSPEAAAAAGFKGLVMHTVDFARKIDVLLAHAAPAESGPDTPSVVVIGGGKSAQDVCAYLANEGKKVTLVCHNLDPFTAGPKPLPEFLRKSRLLSLFSPHIHLRTASERFLHTTWVGKKIVDFMWNGLADSSFKAMNIPADSPLRNTVSPFWHVRVNDEGVPRPNGFHPLAVAGKIEVLSPAHVAGFSEDGGSVSLEDGRAVRASVLVLATGYTSSWSPLFEENTIEELGLKPHLAQPNPEHHWDYTTLSDAPPLHPDAKKWSFSLYRGLVPAKNIHRRDFAVNGACISLNNGYTVEVASHWISSYFLSDPMRIAQTPEEAFKETERDAAWLKRRYPEVPTALNASLTGYLAFWTWPQHVDDLLEDMGLPVMRGGGNGLTWPFHVIDLKEIEHLKEERDAKRAEISS
ncbi:FAD/NAD-P-binding domain-containing protein [Trametes coccinea BRFM310]|uniref:FAD/NAD-P-binding domain-containing protein n=1 Tax=Trametes coccinea (strain BRFM310) TaxID=1353009 RepID=A0A1Y2IBB3_TRAC3|nr:FAD/NAD-P-binding domain-containing protein [Trametes coccinea BRFM310]